MKNKKTLIPLMILMIFQLNLKAQKIHHISINETSNIFYLHSKRDKSDYLGLSLIPELEYSIDIAKNARIYASLLWTKVNDLTATRQISPGTYIYDYSDTNFGFSIGFDFRALTNDNEVSFTVPFVQAVSLGLGFGNFFIEDEKRNKDGLFFILGFKARVFSINLGK